MSGFNEKSDPSRELPISLQGIEKILVYLDTRGKEASSIRNISDNTDLSMRVVKNILLQLEKFNQVERVVEKNNVLPKWRITKFGKRVLKEAKGIEKNVKFMSREDELIQGIIIPDNQEKIKKELKSKQEVIISELNVIQTDLSKALGTIMNLNNPFFEELVSFFIKRTKYLRQKVSNLPLDPISVLQLKKFGEKQRKITKKEEKYLLTEILFFNSIILNQIKRISEFIVRISQFIENEAISNALSISRDLREEMRILTNLINKRESINIDYHELTEEDLKSLLKNDINSDLLDKIINISVTREQQFELIENAILDLINKLNNGQNKLSDHDHEITQNIPLISLYQLILDEHPDLNFTIEQLEKVINSLADKGYIPGIKLIQEDEDHYIKLVQLKQTDISEEETKLIGEAIKLQKFSLADIIQSTGWTPKKVIPLLERLTELGILRHSKSFLQGEQWYIISEKDYLPQNE